jgi:V/A-type H+-transporting ATPase subunit F
LKFFVIGDEDTVLGFSLVGIEGEIARTPEDVRTSLEKTIKKEDIGIIIVSESLAETIRHEFDQYVYKTSFPLIIEIPDRSGPIENRATVREMIRTAVGVHI